MNLIEQLGGYDLVKGIRKKKTSCQFLDFNGRKIHFSKIDRELLEYRREHNIFEVGDFIVYAETEFYEVVGIQGSRNIAVKDINSDFTMSIVSKHCRHTTDEELEAGHRL